ncbi:MAG: peptide ligase PGM1-related protein [Cyanobacteria bacterium P01_D01_bin.128]
MPSLKIPQSTVHPQGQTNQGQTGHRFDVLQQQLSDRWQHVNEFDTEERHIVVIPSLSLDQQELQKIAGVHHYEERLLFALIRLRNPETHVTYVTSQPLHPSIVDYYLELLPGIPSSHARDRLHLFSTYDTSIKPLTQKILNRPRLIERLRRQIKSERAYMTCYNSTVLERELALKLNIPLLAVSPDLLHWGTKSGSRQIFAECGLPHPDGSELVWNSEDLAIVAAELWERQPHLKRMVIKLNEGFSGEGNALLDLRPIADYGPGLASHRERVGVIRDRFVSLRFQCPTEIWEQFRLRIGELGAIAEAFVEGDKKRSPSVQGRITPESRVEVLSTHDQLLGGPDGQIFLGCTFPADPDYRMLLQEMGRQVGRNLAQKGALERYSVDFIAVKEPDGPDPKWSLHAIEINLRKGGTTHPFMAMKLLTDGNYNPDDGQFYTPQGQIKCYQASDNLQKVAYQGLLPSDLIDIIVSKRLHFNTVNATGAAFHLMGCLSEHGKLGLTSIADSLPQANQTYEQVVSALDKAVAVG